MRSDAGAEVAPAWPDEAGPGALARLPPGGGWRTPMQSRAWLAACFETLYADDPACLFEVPGALGPFARSGRLLPVLLLAGAEELAEAIEPPCADAAAAARLAEAVLAARLPVRFGQLPAEGLFAPAFVAAARGRGLALHGAAGGSPVLALDASWRDPLKRFSSRRRSDFRRMQRRAEEFGAVAIEHLSPDPGEVAALMARAFATEAQGWKARSGTAIVQNPAQRGFLGRYAEHLAAEARLRLAFLTIDGTDAAMQIMVEEEGALWLLKIGYDERFARASPGQLLLVEVIRRAAEAGLERVEFLGKAAPWTGFWTETLRPHMRLRYYPATPRGLITLARDGIGVAARRLGQRIAR